MGETRRLLALGLAAAAAIIVFMTIGLRGNLAFVLELRAIRLLALIEIAVAVALATVIFQTVTGNRILTPSIMGLDALYILGQTSLVVVLGGVGFAALDARMKFSGEVALLCALALCLFLPMLRARMDMNLMLLTGVVLGVLFRSLNGLLTRLIDPNAFAVVQTSWFADFTSLETDLVVIGAVLTAAAGIIAWRARHVLDVAALGADTATGLGIPWRPTIAGFLLLVAALTAVSTAVVGPVAFFGLLVVAAAERLVGTRRHAILMPAAALTGIIVLVGGQTVLDHAFDSASTLGVMVEFFGGLTFLILLFASRRP